MALLLGRLGWPPMLAWGATPREAAWALSAMLGPRSAAAPPRSVLDQLCRLFPDEVPS